MKTISKYLLAFLLCISLSCPTEVYAQSWRAGQKAIDLIRGKKKKKSSSSSTETQQVTYGPISDIQMSILSCQRWGNGVKIGYSVTNSSNYDRDIRFTFTGDPCDDKQPEPVIEDNLGYKYNGGPYSLGTDKYVNSLGYLSSTVPAGLTVKGEYVVQSVAPHATSFTTVTIGGNEIKTSGLSPFEYKWTNIPIAETANTDNEAVTCSLPTLFVSYKGAYRDGKNVKIEFTLRNDSGNDIKAWTLRERSSSIAYGMDGDGFDLKWQIGTKTNGESSDLPPEVPVKCTITVMNVPTTVTGFSLVRIGMFENQYKIEFKNLKID